MEEQGSGEIRIYMGRENSVTNLEGSETSFSCPFVRNRTELKMWMKTLGW